MNSFGFDLSRTSSCTLFSFFGSLSFGFEICVPKEFGPVRPALHPPLAVEASWRPALAPPEMLTVALALSAARARVGTDSTIREARIAERFIGFLSSGRWLGLLH